MKKGAPVESRIYFDAPGVVTVSWDASTQVVLMEAHGWAGGDKVRAALEAGLRAARENRSRRLLADCRNMAALASEELTLIMERWLPQLVTAGVQLVAIVAPTSAWAKTHVEGMVGSEAGARFRTQYFGTVAEAQAWLGRPLPEDRPGV